MNKDQIIKKALLGVSGRKGFMSNKYYLVETRIVKDFNNLGRAIEAKAKFEEALPNDDFTVIRMRE